MKINLRILGLMLLCVFAFSVVGCLRRHDQDEEEPEDVVAAFVAVSPTNGSTIQTNATITITFDNPPGDVIASVGTVSVAGKIATITGPFKPGALSLTLTWADGQQTLTYTIPQVNNKEESETGTADPVDEPEEPVAFVSAAPAPGSTISVNASITVTFDNPPGDVTVSAGTAIVADKTATITGPFKPGQLTLKITWADKEHILNYTVTVPDVDAPKITGSTITDGDTAVNPEVINTNAIIEITFNEEIEGVIALQNEVGNDVGWLGTARGNKATLELVKGKELSYETTYVIAGKVSDKAGNETDVKIIFTTTPNPDTDPPEIFEIFLPGFNRGSAIVDLEVINNAGRIEITYDEEVTGNIQLLTKGEINFEDGIDVGWDGNVQGDKATLQLIEDRKLSPGTEYAIFMDVLDTAGNPLKLGILFRTTGVPPARLDGMVRIPAGEFEMGNDKPVIVNGVPLPFPVEQPVHTVHVDAFYIDEYEVTNAQYQQFVLANPQWQKGNIGGSYLFHWTENEYPEGEADHPVRYVNWYAAMAYAEWVGKRLPTEAEWEKAARGRLVGQKYPWGNGIDANKANYNQRIGHTVPVGSYPPPNDYGLYDMSGNVWEWCLDEWDPDFYKHSPRNNPISGEPVINITSDFTNVTTARAVRGGSWILGPAFVRVATRVQILPQVPSRDVGFRCALSP